MASGRFNRNNVLAGLFVLAGIALALVVIVVLSNLGDTFKAMNHYIVRFSIADGADGLSKGSPVKLGGQRIGQVTSTAFVDAPETGEPEFIDVVIELPKNIRLYTDAQVQLVKPLLGTGSSLNIASFTGRPSNNAEFKGPPTLLVNGERIRGQIGGPGFLSPADYGRFQDILARVDRITVEIEPRVGPIMNDAKEITSNVRGISSDVTERWKTMGPQVSTIVERTEKASEKFPAITDSVYDRSEQVKAFIADAQKLLTDNRARIDEAIENVRELTRKAKGEGYDQVMAVIASAKAGVDYAANAARQADELLMRNSPAVTELIADAALAGQQAKLAAVEIRAAPWRLLYQPNKKELENELLYNSVRQYGEAVGELRLAADALRAVTDRAGMAQAPGVPPAVDDQTILQMTAKLREAFDEYTKQEKAFFERWVKEGK